ncbi:putative aspartyl protease [Tieghemostelium lacteum]|uniref:Putative aspartyl protease n=1 Tax=Tieghemostelium lacteum TaxID=361077 RepID=A0A151Z3R4_TIELA|nr:putative aspartyl protease [Tieghemostelium lacteum]|eukprot:KYQ88599.1 putative aspartyl protease [Tieghemostelium lacteum]
MNTILKVILVLFLILPIQQINANQSKQYNDLPLTVSNKRLFVAEDVHKDFIKIAKRNSGSLKTEDQDDNELPLTNKFLKRNILETNQEERIFGDMLQINANVTINGQSFIVQVDTGSSLMAIPMIGCNACAGRKNVYDPKLSNSSTLLNCGHDKCRGSGSAPPQCKKHANPNCDFQILYGDGSRVSGHVFTDTVTLSGLSGKASFGANIIEQGQFEYPRADGIIGFSRSTNPKSIPTVFHTLVQENGIPNVFGIYLDQEGGGSLSLGELNPALYKGDILYTPLADVDTLFYTVAAKGFKIANETVDPDLLGTIIIDSGSTALSFSNEAHNSFIRHLKTHYCHIPGVCSRPNVIEGGHCYKDGSLVEKFPNIEFELDGGIKIVIPPTNYLAKTHFEKGVFGYCFLIDKNEAGSSIFGDVFMRGFYTVFDNENDRIGFAVGNSTSTQFKEVGNMVSGVEATVTDEERVQSSSSDSLILLKPLSSISSVIILTVVYLTLTLYP